MKKIIYRFISRRLALICEKVWGVSPWRVKYLNDVLGVPKKKIGLLVMGGDESFIDWDKRSEIKYEIRNRYGIPQDAFVVVSGGRIDKAKNIHLLINAILELDNPNVYLLIFGKYLDDMKDYAVINNKHIVNAGWLPSSEAYPMFMASDLGCFPGTHSVLWEQACASGLPCIFQYWDGGFSHVDVGGNCVFLKNVTKAKLADTINEIITDKYKLLKMKDVASRKARETFSYIEIAKKSVGLQ